ncbi:hypothetical protein K474DRAFT_1706269 [Panus rudis PR-1116 ss-1]|nr:hypothetical protein K474DRAFT_1706269 [Panus rudis PR-1116 ss-1]
MPQLLKIRGSDARDYAMLERNLLTHLRFATVLILLAASVVLNVRLPQTSGPAPVLAPGVALASLHVAAALICIVAGIWEYQRSFKEIRDMKAFLSATKPHLIIMTILSAVVFATCIAFIVDKSL